MIYSKNIYVYLDEATGLIFGATGLPELSSRSGIPHGTLKYWFQVKGSKYHRFSSGRVLIIRLLSERIYKKKPPNAEGFKK